MSENQVFITGVYRSGTTILTGLLRAHKEIDIGSPSVQYFRYIIKKNISPSLYKDIVISISERVDFRYSIKLDVNRIINDIEKSSKEKITHKLIYGVVMCALHNNSGRRWGEKTLLEWTNIPLFLEMYPSGKTIHIIRDPRDVLASYKHMTYETEEKYLDAIFNCLDSMQHAIEYSKNLSKENYYLVKFEDLVSDRMGQIKKICDYLDIEFNESDYSDENIKEGVGEGSIRLTLETHSSFPNSSQKSFKRWDKNLTKNELDLAEAILGDCMNYFGYDVSQNFTSNNFQWLLKIMKDNPLIKDRFSNYLETGDGAEGFPSDPTDPKNWASATLSQGKELEKGAANAYKKLLS